MISDVNFWIWPIILSLDVGTRESFEPPRMLHCARYSTEVVCSVPFLKRLYMTSRIPSRVRVLSVDVELLRSQLKIGSPRDGNWSCSCVNQTEWCVVDRAWTISGGFYPYAILDEIQENELFDLGRRFTFEVSSQSNNVGHFRPKSPRVAAQLKKPWIR